MNPNPSPVPPVGKNRWDPRKNPWLAVAVVIGLLFFVSDVVSGIRRGLHPEEDWDWVCDKVMADMQAKAKLPHRIDQFSTWVELKFSKDKEALFRYVLSDDFISEHLAPSEIEAWRSATKELLDRNIKSNDPFSALFRKHHARMRFRYEDSKGALLAEFVVQL